MDVSVIIVNYNTLEMTKQCIDSVFQKTTGVFFEVILVDNGSSDGSVEHFIHDKRIKFIDAKINLGFGKANNLGYEIASGKYVLLLNSDTIFVNNVLYEFKKSMDEMPLKVGCLGTILWDKLYKPMHSYGSFPSKLSIFKEVIGAYFPMISRKMWVPQMFDSFPQKVDYITGADLFIRKSVIDKCGLFDPDFFMYYEETEMQYRFNKHGFYSYIVESPHILHLQGINKQKKRKLRSFSLSGRFTYCKKCLSIADNVIIYFMHFLLLPYALLYPVPVCQRFNYIKHILIYK